MSRWITEQRGRGVLWTARACLSVEYRIWSQPEGPDEPAASAGIIVAGPNAMARARDERRPTLLLGSGQPCEIELEGFDPDGRMAAFLVLGEMPEALTRRSADRGVLFV